MPTTVLDTRMIVFGFVFPMVPVCVHVIPTVTLPDMGIVASSVVW